MAIVSAATGTSNHGAIAELLASLDTTRASGERAALLVVRARLAGIDGNWRAADSLFSRAVAASYEEATLEKARFLSLPSLDPPFAMMRGALADLRAPTLTAEPTRTRAELLAALLALRLGDPAPAAAALPRAAEIAATDHDIRALAAELSVRRLLGSGKAAEALAVLLAPAGLQPQPPLRYLRGQALEALGRPREALAWYDVSAQEYGGEWYADAIARAHKRLDHR
jgi:tetratricopeptide (TPR) repeat protein